MRLLGKYLRRYHWYFSIAGLAMLVSIGLDMFNPHLLRLIIDRIIIGKQLNLLQMALLSLLGITVSRAVLGYCKEFLFDCGGQKVVTDLRQDLFDHLQTLSFSYFDGVNTGELMSRLKEDIDNIMRAVVFGFMLFTEQCIYFAVASVLLFALHWKLALLALAVMPCIAWLAFRLEQRIGVVYEQLSDQSVRINTTAQENLAGVRLVKAFGREKYEIQKFLDQNQRNYQLNLDQAAIWSRYHPWIEFLTSLAIVLVTAGGGFLVMREELSVGTLVAFSNYVTMLIWPMRMLGWLTNLLAQCLASVKKVEALFREQPEIADPAAPVVSAVIAGRLRFTDVSFEYNGRTVLRNINLDLQPGSTLAIMGLTGSGKSSLINLIGRYYDRSAGRIELDGVDVRDWPLKLLREQLAVVMQETFLFSDTITENIQFGSGRATPEQLAAAARDAQVDEFVAELPDGYETVIGERGIGLSGGQKQRIALARALVKQCPLLILDDATSNLDMETEYRIQRALERRSGMTKIIIAHRISAVKNADEIIVIEDGAIVERGTHQQLLALGQRYYQTYREQFQGLLELAGKEEQSHAV
ncbi:ATP-binding cassette subfamily B protein [Hydrogenispora ethanolica]|uniref:ATP-binding cassette subfamily B protein n=1 Tax=Hydrogenispora ethanolica TaxID=1082276 RepID=A0A4R1QZA7_HYDET|nr:ABC transporter ATP-binding protein [Hydrogenispora ethanolica]TCL58321.1 ATP-binding cassette subfamily B protein [Hydrogenispora ethanolica]